MKVLVTARFLGGRLEGIGHYTHEVLSEAIRLGPEHTWHLAYDRKEDRIRIPSDNVFHHHLYPPTRHPGLVKLWLWRLQGLIDRIKPDLIWAPDGPVPDQAKCKSVTTIHDIAYLTFPEGMRRRDLLFAEQITPRLIKKVDQIVTVSNYSAEVICSHFAEARNKMSVIHNGVHHNEWQLDKSIIASIKRRYTDGRPYLLYMGSMHPRKNTERLIRAFEYFKSQTSFPHVLILAGRMAWHSEAIRHAVQTSPYRSDIMHLSAIGDIRHALMAGAEMLVYPSIEEGFGLPVLEAMSAGTSVITSRNSAMQEVCGEAATYVDPMDIQEIATMISHLARDTDKRVSLVESGRRRSKLYSWRRSGEEHLRLFEKIVQSPAL